MICIIAGTYSHAKKWAAAQMLTDDEWFSTLDLDDLRSRENFHVVVLDTASELSPSQFERVFHLAHIRGKMNRR